MHCMSHLTISLSSILISISTLSFYQWCISNEPSKHTHNMNNSTKQPPVKHSHEQTRCPARTWRTLSFKSARQFTTASHFAQPSLTKNSPPRPPTSPAHGKNHPVPPRTSATIQFATKQRRAARLRPLGPRDAGKSQAR